MVSLIHPSRGRPRQSFNNAREWVAKAGVDVQLIVSVDQSDLTKMEYCELYQDYMQFRSLDSFLLNDNKSVVEASNVAARVSCGEILLYLSDDFKCFDNWGVEVESLMELDKPQLIKVDDMLQPFDRDVLTIPIMNRKLYESLGYFWFPEYKSMWVDCDLAHVVKKMGVLKLCPELKFEHKHYSVGKAIKDKTYQQSDSNWDHGLEVFNRRKALGFPMN